MFLINCTTLFNIHLRDVKYNIKFNSSSYQDMINISYEIDDKKMMKALIEYRDDMIKR